MTAATRVSTLLAGLAALAAPVLYGLMPATAAGAPVATRASADSNAAGIARRGYPQSRPQKEVPFNPADFDKYAGYYRFGDVGNVARAYRTGSHYYVQLEGQPPVEIFPESPTEFSASAVAARFSFVTAPDGGVTGMVIHQSGMLLPLRRVSRAEFDMASAQLAKRIRSQTPSLGTRRMVIAYIRGLEHGREDFDTMTPQLAAAARPQMPQAVALIRKQGAFKALAFARVAPTGADMYVATFARGKLLCEMEPLSRDGKVTGFFFRPLPP